MPLSPSKTEARSLGTPAEQAGRRRVADRARVAAQAASVPELREDTAARARPARHVGTQICCSGPLRAPLSHAVSLPCKAQRSTCPGVTSRLRLTFSASQALNIKFLALLRQQLTDPKCFFLVSSPVHDLPLRWGKTRVKSAAVSCLESVISEFTQYLYIGHNCS